MRKKDYSYDWWQDSLRCRVCDTKIWFHDNIKHHIENWKLGDLPKKLIIDCPTYASYKTHKIMLDIFVDIDWRLEDE